MHSALLGCIQSHDACTDSHCYMQYTCTHTLLSQEWSPSAQCSTLCFNHTEHELIEILRHSIAHVPVWLHRSAFVTTCVQYSARS